MSIPSTSVHAAWRREIGVLAIWLGLWALTGFFINHLLAAMLAGVSLYLLLHLGYTYKLHQWLLRGERKPPPEGSGVWQEIFLEFHRITQRSHRRKKRLKGIVNEFQASTAALPDGAVVLDPHTRIVWFNDAAASLLRLRSPRDLGQRVANLLRHPQFTEYLAAPDEDRHVEIPAPEEETGVLALRVIPYGNNQRLLIARDISQQKRLEAMRRDFVANASHELRTPLTVLRGYLEMMGEEIGEGDKVRQWRAPIREMTAQAARMGRIIEDLLSLARVEADGLHQEQQVVDVATMIDRLLADIGKAENKRRHISCDLDRDLLLYGRPGELESIASNLIANAMRYTPEDGDINVRWYRDSTAAYLAVSDTGIGIEASHIPRLTERFYRADASRTGATGGTGLGLAIVKHCLEHHEAALQIASEPNVGSCFTCRFPHARVRSNRAA